MGFMERIRSSEFGGIESSAGKVPTFETLLESLQVPAGSYNEWRVRGAEPFGIFVADINNICAKKRVQLHFNGESIDEIGCINITLQSILEAFPDRPVYTLQQSGLCMVIGNDV